MKKQSNCMCLDPLQRKKHQATARQSLKQLLSLAGTFALFLVLQNSEALCPPGSQHTTVTSPKKQNKQTGRDKTISPGWQYFCLTCAWSAQTFRGSNSVCSGEADPRSYPASEVRRKAFPFPTRINFAKNDFWQT